MHKKIFNYIIRNSVKKFSVIAFFQLIAVFNLHAVSNTADAGVVPTATPTATAPVWGKLVIVGNTVTCYYALGTATPSTNAWTRIGVPRTINFLNNPILIGMYITSTSATAVATGTLDNFSITPAAKYRLADYDVGESALMGSANLISGVWNLSGGGTGFGATSDQCNFQSWLVWGDCTVVCRVTSLSAGATTEKIGVMIRDGFNSGSDYALFCAKYNSGLDFLWRTSFNNNADIIQFVAPPAPGVKSSVAVGYGLTGGTTYTLRP